MKRLFSLTLLLFSIAVIGQINDEHLELGDKAPQIVAIDQNGNNIDSKSILKERQILLIFYRGNWCPHCKKHLNSLQDHLQEFEEKGVFVIVVSPESEERTQETATMLESSFAIVHDLGNKIMNDYKPEFALKFYHSFS